jgi:hypothetical protein
MTTTRTPKLYLYSLTYAARLVVSEDQTYYGIGTGHPDGFGLGPGADMQGGGYVVGPAMSMTGNGYGQGLGYGTNSRNGTGKSPPYRN